MNVTFYTESLKQTLLQSKSFIGSPKDNLPILLDVKITAFENGLVTFTTFDMKNYTTISTKANVIQPGTVIVACHKLLEMVKSGDAELTTIAKVALLKEDSHEAEKELVSVTCGSLSVNLDLVTDEFPEWIEGDNWVHQLTVNGDVLASTLNKVLVVASKDEARPVLTGIHFTSFMKGTLVQATDGYKLMRITLPVASTDLNFILSSKAAKGLLTMVAPDMGIHIYRKDTQLKIMVGSKAVVLTQIVQGEFPKTEGIIPNKNNEKFTATIKANRKEFIRQLTAILKFNPDDTAHIVKIITGELCIKLQASGSMGNITLSVPAMVSGSMTTAYNAKYLIEIMKSMSGDTVEIQLTDPLKPCLIEEPILTKAISVIMPVRIKE